MTGVIAAVRRLLLVGPGALDCPGDFGLCRCESGEQQNDNTGEDDSTPHGASFVTLIVVIKPYKTRRPVAACQFTESQSKYTI
jgi:hypothetical protein